MNQMKVKFYVSKEELQKRMRQKNFSSRKLAAAIRKSKSWLAQKWRKSKKESYIIIRHVDARKLTDILGCALQDIGVPGMNKAIDPIRWDYNGAAQHLVEKLLPKYPTLLLNLWQFIKDSDDETISLFQLMLDLFSYICPNPSDFVDTNWWKMLYISFLALDLKDKAKLDEDISTLIGKYTECIKASNEKCSDTAQLDAGEIAKQKMYNYVNKYTRKKIEKYMESADWNDDISNKVTKFLIDYIENQDRDILLSNKVEWLKKGGLLRR